MKNIEENYNKEHNHSVSDTKQSDNTDKFNKFIFWRVEYNQDSKVEKKSFVKPITLHNTWSNYGNLGQLKLFETK